MQEDRIKIIAEHGINAHGYLHRAIDMIHAAKECGADYVKFQKRTPDVVYTKEELDKARTSSHGTTNRELKYALEFWQEEYDQIDRKCKDLNLPWFVSTWDEDSVDFTFRYNIPYLKIASATLTDKNLLEHCAKTNIPLIVSTGGSTLKQIKAAVDTIHKAGGSIECLMHCNSSYPAREDELNLRAITTLQKEFPEIDIGYSGHEVSPFPSVYAAVLGAKWIERHFTLDRTWEGSDQAASLMPHGFAKMVDCIRQWERTRGDGVIRCYASEMPVMEKLRRKDTLDYG